VIFNEFWKCLSCAASNARQQTLMCVPINHTTKAYLPCISSPSGLCCTPCVGDSHKGPLITRENPLFFRKIIKHKRTRHEPQKHTLCGHGPKKPQRPTKRSTAATLERFFASLEGLTPPRAILRLARGSSPPPRASLRLARGCPRLTTPNLLPRPDIANMAS
jgi:hypothetical protein